MGPLSHLLALFRRRDIDDDDSSLLPGLYIAIGIDDRLEGVFSFDDRTEFACLHAGFRKSTNVALFVRIGKTTLLLLVINDQTAWKGF